MSFAGRSRNLGRSGIAERLHGSAEDRVIDLLSDIMLASEEIESMVSIESPAPPYGDFYAALHRIYSEAASILGHVVDTRRGTETPH